MLSSYCTECKRWYQPHIPTPIRCVCGNKIYGVSEGVQAAPKTVYEPVSCDVNWNTSICRSNKCGFYDAKSDACLKVIEIGKAKGKNRAGKISWLHYHKNASCPADPPMFDGPTDPADVMRILEDQEL